MSVHWPILRRLLAHPLRVCAVDDRRSWRGIDLLVGAMHLADRIERESSGDKVAVLLPTGGAFPMAALACWSLGRTLVPLNYLLNQDEVEWIIRHSGSDIVISAGAVADALGWAPTSANLVNLEDVSFTGFPSPRIPATAKADDLAALLYTSGTSGRPKGVMLTHGNVRANVSQIRRWVTFTTDDIVLGALPQFHSFGFTVLTVLPLITGMKVVYTARWVPKRVIELIREHKPTMFVGLPSMYNALLRVKSAEADDFDSFRYIVSGGEPLPDAVFNAFEERFGVRIHEGYGLTETAPVTNWLRPEEFRRHSVGRAVPDCRIRIVHPESGREVGPNREGEIRIAGPNIMAGYYRDPEQTASVFDEDGWFRTGDMGRLDREGFLYITGRIKEMLIIAGENVFPREIEEVLNRHPAVQDSGVVGEPDDLRGEIPVAFIELAEGASFDEAAIRDFCFERLARHKSPRRIVRLDALPRNPTGKIMRRRLKEMLAAAGSPEAVADGRRA
jgi:long-chain acyl-CoA synthetase